MSLERVFVICINGSFCFVLSLLTALSFPSFFPVLSLLAASSFLFLSFHPFSSSLASSLASFENKNVKRYNVKALSEIKNVTM